MHVHILNMSYFHLITATLAKTCKEVPGKGAGISASVNPCLIDQLYMVYKDHMSIKTTFRQSLQFFHITEVLQYTMIYVLSPQYHLEQ